MDKKTIEKAIREYFSIPAMRVKTICYRGEYAIRGISEELRDRNFGISILDYKDSEELQEFRKLSEKEAIRFLENLI